MSAYRQGMEAALQLLPPADNPYRAGSSATYSRDGWFDGYTKASLKLQEAQQAIRDEMMGGSVSTLESIYCEHSDTYGDLLPSDCPAQSFSGRIRALLDMLGKLKAATKKV